MNDGLCCVGFRVGVFTAVAVVFENQSCFSFHILFCFLDKIVSCDKAHRNLQQGEHYKMFHFELNEIHYLMSAPLS